MTSRTPIVVALAGICLASTLGYLLVGDWVGDSTVRVIQQLGVIGTVLGVILGVLALIVSKLSDYQEPASDDDFERVVARSEFLAEQGLAVDPDEGEFLARDPFDDHDFEKLVRDALDDLPDLLLGVLDTNVAVVISDLGRRHGAYGLYMGDGATRDDHSDRIMIFRDTLRRDFGHDPDLLREQVTITVRHELAHHVGFDELGVRDLGL
ncbi:metallopeptidase family protein [Patulibacter americanus]|uniref:metallopeptidase family protein n=1 Tax=Patulibacter americanus TaxID=588672 RepID=UPI0003B31E5E|nr:metallopeptidase family protein [Patulibacter americanus]